jgi:hypothetical protein
VVGIDVDVGPRVLPAQVDDPLGGNARSIAKVLETFGGLLRRCNALVIDWFRNLDLALQSKRSLDFARPLH